MLRIYSSFICLLTNSKRASSSVRESSDHNQIKQSSKYRSSESINVQHVTTTKTTTSTHPSSRRTRNPCGGSLTNLVPHAHSSCGGAHGRVIYSDDIFSSNCDSGYFSKNACRARKQQQNHSTSHLMQSYLDLCEYNSAPYYQYQRKNLKKKDFACSAIHLDTIMRHHDHDHHEHVEIHIPIRIVTPPEIHRNEKHIIVNSESSDSLRHHMRKYIDERLNKFEAEITFYNLSSGGESTMQNNVSNSSSNSSSSSLLSSSCSPRHHHLLHHHSHHHHHLAPHSHTNVLAFRQVANEPVCMCHCRLLNGATCSSHKNSSCLSRVNTTPHRCHHCCSEHDTDFDYDESSKPSVTNLMLMQIVNGRLIE